MALPESLFSEAGAEVKEERDSSLLGVEVVTGVWQLAKREAKASAKIIFFLFMGVHSLPILSHLNE